MYLREDNEGLVYLDGMKGDSHTIRGIYLGVVLDNLSVSVPACARRCGHVSEETKNADRMCPWGIMMAVGSSVVLGFGYILALLFSVQVHHPAISHK